MILSAVRDTPYNIVLFLHILLVIVGLAPAVAFALLGGLTKKDGGSHRQWMFTHMASSSQKVFANALILAGLLGFALVGMSDKVISFGDAWISISILIWVAMVGLLHGAIIPAEKALAAGDASGDDKLMKFGMFFNLLALVMLYLMVFKPGA